jgi:Ca2+-binding EF-hand superfamily protein
MAVFALKITGAGRLVETFPVLESFYPDGPPDSTGNLSQMMKTVPVSLIVVGIMAPFAACSQEPGAPPREGDPKRGPQRPFVDYWKFADKDHDGFLSREEFEALPRVQKVPEDKRADLFARLDKNSDGRISREELFRIAMPRDDQGTAMPRLWELDTDKSGGVSMEEFKAGRPFNKLPADKQEALFRRLDTDGDGMITPKDHPQTPFRHGPGDSQRPWHSDGGPFRMEPRQIIRQLDKDGDGALSFEEFRAGPMEKKLSEDEQEKHFQNLDKNHDSKLSADELQPPMPRREPRKQDGPEAPPAPTAESGDSEPGAPRQPR